MASTKLRRGKRRIKATRRKQLKNKVSPKKALHLIDVEKKKRLRKELHRKNKINKQ